jgi:hypothetical protein
MDFGLASAESLTILPAMRRLLWDETVVPPAGEVSLRRRFLQHLNTARLWMPDAVPWWVVTPSLRPLYTWIRELHPSNHPVLNIEAERRSA